MASRTLYLNPGEQLMVSADANSAGNLVRLANHPGGGGQLSSTAIAASGRVVVGPYSVATRWSVDSTAGLLAYATAAPPAEGDLATGGAGVAAGGAVAAEYGAGGAVHKTVLTLTNIEVALTDEAGTIAHGNLKIYDFPAGAISILGAVADLDVTKDAAGVNADWDGDFALGTAAAAADATLSSTEANVIASTATPQASSGATTANGATATAAIVNGTTTPVDLYFNVLVDDADHDVTTTPTNLILNGTITVLWANLGDF